MTTYAIGDVQGCHSALTRLLDRLAFDPARDRLIFVGDLVNRGLGSLATLRQIRALGDRAATVLGNHDLFLLAAAIGAVKIGKDDTIHDILAAPDRDELLDWLRHQPLARREDGCLVVHAGLLPEWDAATALALSGEVEAALTGPDWRDFLHELWGNKPDRWSDELQGIDRLRVIVNAMTRMRFVTRDGALDLRYKGELDGAPDHLLPWFDAPGRRSAGTPVVCGHWSALGLMLRRDVFAIDTGCVWGGQLTALDLATREVISVECADLPDARPIIFG